MLVTAEKKRPGVLHSFNMSSFQCGRREARSYQVRTAPDGVEQVAAPVGHLVIRPVVASP